MRCLVVIVGPTAVGKSSVSIQIARDLNGEIINADSRQIYRYMDIGTSKPSVNERSLVKHHLFDIIDPDQPFSVALYGNAARSAISDIQSRGNLPVLTGGSGLYIWSMLENWSVPAIPPDYDFREKMMALAGERGNDYLYKKLVNIDPAAAGKILPGNLRRIIRALEIHEVTKQKPSSIQRKGMPLFPILVVGLDLPRSSLYQTIDNRVDDMIEKGFIEEVKKIDAMGYHRDLPSMSSIGYKQLFSYLAGEINLDEAVWQIKMKTHAFARRQYAWFRLQDARIHWYNREVQNYNDIILLINKFINITKRDGITNGFY